jgi:hypothetical protein
VEVERRKQRDIALLLTLKEVRDDPIRGEVRVPLHGPKPPPNADHHVILLELCEVPGRVGEGRR